MLVFLYIFLSETAKKVSDKNKAIYDRQVKDSALAVGDRVLVRKVGFQGKHKLADKWEQQPYIVCGMPDPTIPVYVVRPESDTKSRTA